MNSPVTKFLVAGPARSGTSLTHHILKGHPHVSALHDDVSVEKLFGADISVYTCGNDLPDERNRGFVRLFDLLATLNASADTKAAGIKCPLTNPRQAALVVERLRQSLPECKVVLTVREDLLAQYASLQRAKASGRWHSWDEASRPAASRMNLDEVHYSRYFLRSREAIGILRTLKESHECLEIGYERDMLNGSGYAGRLYAFLGLDYIEPSWVNCEKISPPVQELVANYEALRQVERQLVETNRPLTYGFGALASRKVRSVARRVAGSFSRSGAASRGV